ncbi:TetR family transcriptional regulator [Nocardioides sp. C4-1]|uniref:TetR/AcrR family transcriptional regulator n=1 Tax=Nocardioides sp. C4-1 TaxID=3151851 RepID=UPI0032664438
MTSSSRGPRGTGHVDPQRPQRIVEAALEVIVERGVARTTHRAIAERGGVPLGSVTYHFASLDDVLWAAFSQVADRVSSRFEQTMSDHVDGDPREGVTAIITEFVTQHQDDLLLSFELYVLAARDVRFRRLMEKWQHTARGIFAAHFDVVTARMVDALLEGLLVHAALSTEPVDPGFIAAAVARIAG